MTQFVALLRAVNLGRHGKVAMKDLTALADRIGLQAPRTLLQTGNLLFGSDADEAALVTRLEQALAEHLHLKTEVIVRSAAEWRGLVEANPLAKAAADDPAHLVVMALKAPPPAGWIDTLRAAIRGREAVAQRGRDLYVVYPDGIGRSKLNTAAPWRRLGTVATARNWNTATRIAAAFEA